MKRSHCGRAKSLARSSIHPVGRAVQAAVCKTAEAGAIPARDSISPGISVERYTPVFQTGVERALLSCPSISRDAKSRCRPGLHRPGRGGSTPPSRRVRVASIAAMQRSLKPQSTGQHHPSLGTEQREGFKRRMSSIGSAKEDLPSSRFQAMDGGPFSHPW